MRIAPLLHPAFVLRTMEWQPVFRRDMARALDTTYRGVDAPAWPVVPCAAYEAIRKIASAGCIAVDLETDGKPFGDVHATLLGVCTGSESLIVLGDDMKAVARYILHEYPGTVVFHNMAYDLQVMDFCWGLRPAIGFTKLEDTFLYHLATYAHYPHSLAFLASIYTNLNYWKSDRLATDPQTLMEYNAKDTWATWQSWRQLPAWEWARPVYEDYKRLTLNALMPMIRRGVYYDPKVQQTRRKEIDATLTKLLQKMHRATRSDFNPLSPVQVLAALDKMGIPHSPFVTEKMENASTGKEALYWMLARVKTDKQRGFLHALLAYKTEHAGLQHVNVEPSSTGRIHTNIHFGPLTGRLAGGDPVNLLNVGRSEEEEGVVIGNRLITAERGKTLHEFDFSQLETWVRAALADCGGLLTDLRNGVDDHGQTTRELFGEKNYTKQLRTHVKRMVHGGDKGGGAKEIAKELLGEGIYVTQEEVQAVLDFRNKRRPELPAWRWKMFARARERGYIDDVLSGRRLYISSTTRLPQVVSFMDQSGAAAIMNAAWLKVAALPVVLQCYDSLLVETDRKQDVQDVLEAMQTPVEINGHVCRIPVKHTAGRVWRDLKEVNRGG